VVDARRKMHSLPTFLYTAQRGAGPVSNGREGLSFRPRERCNLDSRRGIEVGTQREKSLKVLNFFSDGGGNEFSSEKKKDVMLVLGS